MTPQITLDHFTYMLNDPDVPDCEIARYLRPKPGGRGGLNPEFEPDPDLVQRPEIGAESAMTIGNWWCRQRRRARFKRDLAAGSTKPVIVTEGDSWFQFPFVIEDVIDHLEDDYLVWSCGAAGATAEEMIFDRPEYMEALREQKDSVTAFLFSAAGNDVVGQDENGDPMLARLLHPYRAGRTTARDLINKAELERILARLKEGYIKVIATIRRDPDFRELPILIHGYDHALPYRYGRSDNRSPWWAKKDAWVGTALNARGIHDLALRTDIVEYLINRLYDMLSNVAEQDPWVHLVDVRGTLTMPGRRSTALWADEIHGTDEGFARVAGKFRSVLRNVVIPKAPKTRRKPEAAIERSRPIVSPTPIIESEAPVAAPSTQMGFEDLSKFAQGMRRANQRLSRRVFAEAIVGEDDSKPFRYLPVGARRGDAVCRIEARGTNYKGGTGHWSGTGFMIAPNILLTNYHVINSWDVAAEAVAIFNDYEVAPGDLSEIVKVRLDPERLFIASPFDDLDYAFVWVEGDAHRRFGSIPFWRGSMMSSDGAPANIIHHPGGDPKKISDDKNEVVDLGQTDALVHYTTDTEGGSSGAPVMRDDWRLFALHHAAIEVRSSRHRQMIREAGYSGSVLNEGIKTSAIALDIDYRAANGPDEAMALEVQRHIGGTDSRTGFFGALGRTPDGGSSRKIVSESYRGAPFDVDMAFWNIGDFSRASGSDTTALARVLGDLNLDIWVFQETTLDTMSSLIEQMRDQFGLTFGMAVGRAPRDQAAIIDAVIWNTRTVAGERVDWSDEVERLFGPDAAQAMLSPFQSLPLLLRFEALNLPGGHAPFAFNLVPFRLDASFDDAAQRDEAGRLLTTAIAGARASGGCEADLVLGGDARADITLAPFDLLKPVGFDVAGASNERGGAFTHVAHQIASPVSRIFISPDLLPRANPGEILTPVPDRVDPGFPEQVSDHRPVALRLSIADQPAMRPNAPVSDEANEMLQRFLRELKEEEAMPVF